jgi:acyl-CoA thioester hydrolase
LSATAHRFLIRVYYEDTDFSGVVYHANYLRFLERGRTEMLRERGIDQAALFAGPVPFAFAVARMEIDFRKPARMDDALTIETAVAAIGGASVALRQRLLRGADLLVEASVKIAAVSQGRATRLPSTIASRLRA